MHYDYFRALTEGIMGCEWTPLYGMMGVKEQLPYGV